VSERPSVSALIAAYNYERYVGRAIASALAQDYPPELLEVVVVDDGSTDNTAIVVRELAARFPQRRIRLISQPNGGLTSAINRALGEADGELLAVLDADDVWMPDKIRRNQETLAARPELGLVFSDMAIVGPEDQLIHASLFGWAWGDWRPPRGRVFPRLLAENFVTASSITLRASLRGAFAPIPAAIPYPDWWLAASVARVAELDYEDEPLALYRLHGANLTGGASGASLVRERRKDLDFQFCCLRNLPLESLSAQDAEAVWSGVENKARMALDAADTPFFELVPIDPLAAEPPPALGEGEPDEDARALLGALARNPFRPQLRAQLREAAQRAAAADTLPDPLAGARRFVALADAEELLDDQQLLAEFAAQLGGAGDVTLAIDASRLEPQQAVSDLRSLIERCGLVGTDAVHLMAVFGELAPAQRRRMLASASALYGAREQAGQPLPSFTPASLAELRALAA
jgi:hypothetical protein